MKARYVIGKKLLKTVPFMKAGSAAICLVATTMEAYVAYIKLQKAREDLDSDKTKGNMSNHELARAIHKGMATDYSRQSTERAKKNDIVKFGMCSVCIRKVIFNDPATVVLWSDGTKTVVKCGPNDIFDKEKGLAMAIVKKMAGNDSRFHKIFKKWCKPDETNEDAGAYAKVLKELDQVAAQTKDSIMGLLAKMSAAMH